MKVLQDYNSQFHRCIDKSYPYRSRTLEESVSLLIPNPSCFRSVLEIPFSTLSFLLSANNHLDINTSINSHTIGHYYIDSDEDSLLVFSDVIPDITKSWNDTQSYLNTVYNQMSYKDYIKPVNNKNIFLLSRDLINNPYYFKNLSYVCDGSTTWWLSDEDDSSAYAVDGVNKQIISMPKTNTASIRYAFRIYKSYFLDNFITPLYNQSVEVDHYHRFTIREQLSNHNESYFGDKYKSFLKVKKDIAIYTKTSTGYSYNFPYRNKVYTESSLQDGIYFYSNKVIKVQNGNIISTYSKDELNIDKMFYNKNFKSSYPYTVELSTTNFKCFYLDCWEDLDLHLFKYLPVFIEHGTIPTLLWLGNRYTSSSPIYNDLNDLRVNFSQYI